MSDDKKKIENIQDVQKLPKEQMRQFVVERILQVNPELAQGRSAEEFLDEVTQTAKHAKHNPAQGTRFDARFSRVFSQMLATFEEELDARNTQLSEQHEALESRQRSSNQQLVDRLIAFLKAVEPGDLSERTLAVLRDQLDFLKSLGISEVAELNRRVRASQNE